MACNCNYLLVFVYLLWKLINIFYYCDHVNIIHLILLCHDWSTENNIEFYITKWKVKVKMRVAQSCQTLCNPMDCIVHWILQARILEWVAFPFSRGLNPGLLHCRWTLYQMSHKISHISLSFFYMSLKLPFNKITCNCFLKSRCIIELSWNVLKNTSAQVLLFFSKAPDAYLMSSHVYKQLYYMMIFHFYLVCFTFSVSYSVLSFYLVYVFSFSFLFCCCSSSSLYQV